MRRGRVRALMVPVVLAALLAGAACAPTTDPATLADIDPAAQSALDSIRELPFDESRVHALSRVLTAAGVEVVEGPDPGDSAVSVTSWQTGNMAAEVANGGGLTGAELAELAPVPDGVPPLGYLVAAWASVYDTDGARFARAVFGAADLRRPDQVLFPKAVLTLFLADAVAAEDDGSPSAAGNEGMVRDVVPASAAGNGPCTAATNLIHHAIGSIADALKVKESSGFFGFLGRIWNKAIDLATGLVEGLIEVITRPVVTLLVDVFSVVGIIQQVSTFVTVWRIDLTPDPRETRFGVGDEIVTGTAALTVRDNRLKLPALLLDCAAAIGVDLARVGSAAGSAITWDPVNDPRPDLTVTRASDAELDDEQSATYEFATGQESAALARDGDEQGGMLRLRADVHRNDLEQVRQLFTRLLLDQVPAAIRPLVDRFAAPVLGEATRHLASLGDVRATAYVWVGFHAPREKKPKSEPPAAVPPASPQPPDSAGCGLNGVAPGRYALSREQTAPTEYSSSVWEITVDLDGAISGAVHRVRGGTDFEGDYEWILTKAYGGTVAEPTVTVTAATGAFLEAEEALGGGVGTTSVVLPYSGDCNSLVLTDEIDITTGQPRVLPRQ